MAPLWPRPLGTHLPGPRDRTSGSVGHTNCLHRSSSIGGLLQAAAPVANQPLSAPMADVVQLKATHTLDEAAQQKLLYPEFVRAVADLGLRGMMLQMKVERAMSAADLLALRDQVEAAVAKSKGEPARQAFSDRLNSLLSQFYWR